MEDVLELYEEPYDSKRPVVCFDEMPYQMVAEKRTPLPQKPGLPERYDYEYERKGMLNIFASRKEPCGSSSRSTTTPLCRDIACSGRKSKELRSPSPR